MMMKPKLLVCAAAAAVASFGCATHSTLDWNNGPYAEYGFTYDYVLSPVAALSTDDAQAVLALPSGTAPALLAHRNNDVSFYQQTAPASNTLPPPAVVQNIAPAPAPAPPPADAAPPK